jgi:hypothetical protein
MVVRRQGKTRPITGKVEIITVTEPPGSEDRGTIEEILKGPSITMRRESGEFAALTLRHEFSPQGAILDGLARKTLATAGISSPR